MERNSIESEAIETASALPYDIASRATPNFSSLPPINAPDWPTGSKRLQLSAKEWDELKPTIQRLYIEEGKKFKEVATILQTNHDFTPTYEEAIRRKAQKVESKKDATRTQRRMILQELRNEDEEKSFQEGSLKLNPGKLERWEREEKLSGSLGKPASKAANASVPKAVSTSKSAVQRPPDRALSPLREIIEIHSPSPNTSEKSQTIWDWANIPRSPNLTAFFTAIKVDNEFPMLPLLLPPPRDSESRDPGFITKDQWTDIIKTPSEEIEASTSQTTNKCRRISRLHQQETTAQLYICQWLLTNIEKPWTPLNEVYPFPKVEKARNRNRGVGTYIVKSSPVKKLWLKIMETEQRLGRLEAVKLEDEISNSGAVAQMDDLAYLYSRAGRYERATILHGQVASARQETLGAFHLDTISSYLDFIENLSQQDHNHDTYALQRDLDSQIQKLFYPSHSLALRSRTLLAVTLNNLGNDSEAEILQREMLQITLNEFGQRHEATRQAMRHLGDTIQRREQYAAGEVLLRTSLQIHVQVEEAREYDLYYNKLYLGEVLGEQGNYAESRSLLRDAVRWAVSMYGMDHRRTMDGINRLGRVLQSEGELDESELLQRGALRRYIHTTSLRKSDVLVNIARLAGTICEQRKWSEAVTAYEYLVRGSFELYGHDHDYTQAAIRDLDSAYEVQGLYDSRPDFEARLQHVFKTDEDLRTKMFTMRRKCRPKAEEADSDSDEVEERRPCKRRQTMTCTINLKSGEMGELRRQALARDT